MTEAIFGLVGVVVGGLITGGLQWWDRWDQRRIRRRAALRLVLNELRANLNAIRFAHEHGRWWRDGRVSLDALRTHRAELAAVLSDEEWEWIDAAEAEVSLAMSTRDHSTKLRENDGPWARLQVDRDDGELIESLAEGLAGALEELGVDTHVLTDEEMDALIDGVEPSPTAIDFVRRASGVAE
ncbi:MAG: hypothetical protein AB7I38_19500 [Dehalococcoidia bacterium]